MGIVYRVSRGRDRQYAVKVLYGELSSRPELVARFEREAERLSRIEHPNVVRVYETGRTEEGVPFLAMELVEGATLADAIAAQAPMPPDRVAELASQLADGLAALHAEGVVHRDLKPGNVMLAADAGRWIPKIVDFGGLHDAELGTPLYMAPEQTGRVVADERADLYALGTIMFELLTARLPFAGTVPEVIGRKLVEDAPPAPPAEGLGAVIDRLLRRDPGARLRDARAVQRAIAARRPPKGPAAGRWWSPRELFVVTLLILVLSASFGFAVARALGPTGR